MLGFENATVYPDDFTVLVGANNSGKSSLMRAISFAQTLLRVHVEREDAEHVVLARGRNLDDSLLPVPEVKDLWYGGIRRVGNDWVMAEIELEFETGLVLGFGLKGPFGHATSRLLDDSSRQVSRADFDRLTAYPIVYVP
jgi:predicted ATPase